MTSKPFRVPILLAAACSLAAVATAQTPLPVPFTQLRWDADFDWIGSAPNGTFGRSLAGDFKRDGGRDVFVVSGTNLLFVFDPATWDAIDPNVLGSAIAVTDVDEVRSSTGFGSDLLVVSSVGLSRVQWNKTTEEFDLTTISTSGSWPGATFVRAEDIDQNGTQDIVGIASNQRTVIMRMNGST